MRVLNILLGAVVVSLEIYFLRIIYDYSKLALLSTKSADNQKMRIIIRNAMFGILPMSVTIAAAVPSMLLRKSTYSFVAQLIFFGGSTCVTINGLVKKKRLNEIEVLSSDTKTTVEDISIPSYDTKTSL